MMHIQETLSDAAVLSELGRRLERHRVQRDRTQAELAEQAGIGRATLQRIERGESVQLLSLVKLLRTLDLLEALDGAVPATIELPIAQLDRERRPARRRARRRRDAPDPPPWTWGDDASPERGR